MEQSPGGMELPVPPRKRGRPKGMRCRRITITLSQGELDRIDRRRDEFRRRGMTAYATRSGAVRADMHAARHFHHGQREEINSYTVIASALRKGAISPEEAADAIEETAKSQLNKMLEV